MTIVREGNLMDKEAKRKRAWWIGERANVNFTAHINISSRSMRRMRCNTGWTIDESIFFSKFFYCQVSLAQIHLSTISNFFLSTISNSLTWLSPCHTVSLDLNRIFLEDKDCIPVLLLFCEQSQDFDLDLPTETRTVRSQDSTKILSLRYGWFALRRWEKKRDFCSGKK